MRSPCVLHELCSALAMFSRMGSGMLCLCGLVFVPLCIINDGLVFATAGYSPRTRPWLYSVSEKRKPPLPLTAFACAAYARGYTKLKDSCSLYSEEWKDWREYQEKLGRGRMSFPHPLDNFYQRLRVPMGVPPLVGIPPS
eukprot:gnl/TRDRNA2_/TRDRNA2_150104_c0_seq1.p1 gnl/TRDRNA2_/TRDRNA2_150104_c0~~gnl/TRDRNA2_/TRDRNA2_150104_c0_seq1.p1  ORF type:complete len:140 (-),score=0.66 gnl/TRDRNA2_/TRDRNA2_150104_c0_seq1:84-503(-)